MPDNPLDEFFRNKLKDYPSQVPTYMWQRIQAKKDKGRKIFFFWQRYFFGSLLLLASLVGGYFVWNGKSEDKGDKKDIFSTESSAGSKTVNSEKKIGKIKNREPLDSAQVSYPIIPTAWASISKKGGPNNHDEVLLHAMDKNHDASGQYIVLIRAAVKNYRTDQKIKKTNSQDNPQTSTAPFVQVTLTKEAHGFPKINTRQSDSVAKTAPEPLNNNLEVKKLSAQQDSLVKKVSLISQNKSEKDNTQRFLKKRDWFIESFGSPDIAFNNITPASLKSYFQPELSYTIGARFGKTFGKNFSGKIGVQYSQINESSRIDSFFLNRHMHFRSIDVPLLIGYDIRNLRYAATINAGLIYNIFSWHSGQRFGSSANDIYKQHTGFSLYLGLNYVRPLNDRLLIFTEPYFRYRLSNMVRSDAGFTQKIHVAGLTFGVRYIFKKSKQLN